MVNQKKQGGISLWGSGEAKGMRARSHKYGTFPPVDRENSIVAELKQRLENLKLDGILESNYIAE
ncbi:spore germination protein [Brevibacillus marinus]|uniref:spore germination protein n=1 Tax=Brevibacillus marinus TaxID=2496837 RepID=UPI0013DFED7B|nr:spore germination protein [Brevibacillus marinus]